MKFLCSFVFAGALMAQTAPAPTPPPPPPANLPDLPDDSVVATFSDGTKVTMAEVRGFYSILSPQQQQAVLRDLNAFLHQWGVMRRLAQIGVEKKLNERSPYKEAIEQQRMNVLSQAAINDTLNTVVVDPADISKYYDSNQAKYTQVKVKSIYIAYSETPGTGPKKKLTEPEAKAKATKLLAAIRGGADFVKLVKENSEDETSREKNGDFATLRFSDNIPDAFREAIFKLKQGETTEPLKQPNGYYLFRAEEITVKPLSDVRDEIYNDLKNQKWGEWMAKINSENQVTLSPAFSAAIAKK
jgi:peptidyl-prolyl cis-trans isomerase C